MLHGTCAAALILTTLLSGCSRQRLLDDEELKGAATEIISIASEGELLAAAAGEKHVGANYAKGHPEYLRKQVEDVTSELSQGRADGHAQHQFERLRQSATQLMETLQALPANVGDPSWHQSSLQLDSIRREAEEIRRKL